MLNRKPRGFRRTEDKYRRFSHGDRFKSLKTIKLKGGMTHGRTN